MTTTRRVEHFGIGGSKQGGRGMFYLNIETDNAAFSDDAFEAEIARILRRVADRVERGEQSGGILDVNGNGVGDWDTGR